MVLINPPPATAPRWLRIVVMDERADLWCDTCAAPSAVEITYIVEENGTAPELSRLAYCRVCDDE